MSTIICSGYCSFVCFLLLSNAWTIFFLYLFHLLVSFSPKQLLLRILYFDILNFDSHLCSSWFGCINRYLGLSVSTCLKNIVFSWLLTRCSSAGNFEMGSSCCQLIFIPFSSIIIVILFDHCLWMIDERIKKEKKSMVVVLAELGTGLYVDAVWIQLLLLLCYVSLF